MNEFTVLREHGPEPTPLSEDVLARARADLLTEINAGTRRPVRLRRRAVIITAAAAAAAVVAGAVAGIVATSGTDTPPSAEAPPAPITLVRFDMPAPPPVLNTIPDGVNGPGFTAEPGWIAAVYNSADRRSAIGIRAARSRPTIDGGRDTTHGGKPAVLGRVDQEEPEYHSVSLTWEWSAGRWITLSGSGDYADELTVRSLADTLVDTDEPLSLDVTVAPAGWELYAFKGAGPDGDGAVTSLYDPRDPDRLLHVSTMLEMWPDYGRFVEGGPLPVVAVTINGRAGELVHLADDRWMLQAPLPDGRAFQLQVPAGFTQQQVIELAEGVH